MHVSPGSQKNRALSQDAHLYNPVVLVGLFPQIYLISNLQRVKLIFNMKPNEVERVKQQFVDSLSAILKVDLVMDRVVSHTASDGSKDASKSDAYLHGWYQSTGEMVPAAELRSSLDFNQEVRALLYKYDVSEAQTIDRASTDDDNDELTRLFAIIIVVLGVFVVALILVLVHMIRMYRRRLRAATTMAYAAPKEQEMYEHPGTNKYYAAENPLYGKEIKHAVIDDDKTSQNSLDMNAVDAGHILPPSQKRSAAPPVPLPSLSSLSPQHQPLQNEEQEVVMQISDLDPSTNVRKNSITIPNGDAAIPDKPPTSDNHIANLDQVLQAYTNSAFEGDDEDEDDPNRTNEEKDEKEQDFAGSNVNNKKDNSGSSNLANASDKHKKPARRISSSAPTGVYSLGSALGPGVGSLYIPGVGDDVQEGVTRFSDEILSSDSGYPDGVDSGGSHRNYTDI
ncbi:cadherin-23 [Elysia marginata]|uniref:Cadherin-23 n=1 Tax=Elysia marginata TaxID=1093978 RepID=A0AAV4F271_9GAST|nr:cadherin-23 [Elysia marginata]